MEIILVAAYGKGSIRGKEMPIGVGGKIPWLGKLPIDMKHFRKLTLGKTIVMGRKTYDSIGGSLPGRNTIVLTRNDKWYKPNVFIASNIASILERCSLEAELIIVGGAEIYRQFLPIATHLELTEVDIAFEGDAHFPPYDIHNWRMSSATEHEADKDNIYACRFLSLEKIPPI